MQRLNPNLTTPTQTRTLKEKEYPKVTGRKIYFYA